MYALHPHWVSHSRTVGRTPRRQPSSVTRVARRPVFEYRREFKFPLSPEDLWQRMEQVDQFERWWPWLQEFHVEGDGLAAGSVLHGVVAPPLPYRMRVRVEIMRCEPPRAIDAAIAGDLEGEARLRV